MFSIGEEFPDSEKEDEMEISVFGGFDPDDPDFLPTEETSSMPPRPRSRLSGSRNSSSSSLRRIASNHSMGRQLSDNLRQISYETLPENGTNVELQLPKNTSNSNLSQNNPQVPSNIESTQCHECGCKWNLDHYSLDCNECGGSALTLICPNCNGACGQVWKRDITSSHVLHKAGWIGQCRLDQTNMPTLESDHDDTEDNQVMDQPDKESKQKLKQVIRRLED